MIVTLIVSIMILLLAWYLGYYKFEDKFEQHSEDYVPWFECDDCRELLDNCKCKKKFKK